MGRYFRALWLMVTGRFSEAYKSLMTNKHVMSETYDRAILNRAKRFETVKSAIAELINIENDRKNEIKAAGERITKLNNIKLGAQAAMQKRIDTLKSQGMAKEQIVNDVEFIKHKAAYEDASATLVEVQTRFDEKNSDLEDRQKEIANYKVELQQMQRDMAALKEEKHEAIADVTIAKQREEVNSMLNGLPKDSIDEDLAAAREARKRAKSISKVAAELNGNDAKIAENEYLQYAQYHTSTAELDGLLNWGDAKESADMSPAKLPE